MVAAAVAHMGEVDVGVAVPPDVSLPSEMGGGFRGGFFGPSF